MKKKILLLLILVIPSAIAFLMEYSQVNFKKLPFYGPKLPQKDRPSDTVFYSLLNNSDSNLLQFSYLRDTSQFPIIVVNFLLHSRRKELYNAGAMIDALKYRYERLSFIESFMNVDQSGLDTATQIMGSIVQNYKNVHLMRYQIQDERQFLDRTFFFQKPYYIDYNFLILLDKKRRIRGYYDPRYAAEIKRMYEEFKHLKIHDEAKDTRSKNKLDKQ